MPTSKLELRWRHSNRLISSSRRRREKKEQEKAIEEKKEIEKEKGVLPEPSPQDLRTLQDLQNLQNLQNSHYDTVIPNILQKISSYVAVLNDMMGTSATTPSPSPAPAMRSSPAASVAGAKRKRATPGKYYAVKKGYQPGVYFEWNDCLTQVTGYKGAVCKLFMVYSLRGWLD